jgi:hypothetical protein
MQRASCGQGALATHVSWRALTHAALLRRAQLLEKPAEVNTGAKAAAARTIYFMLALARRAGRI